MEYGRYEVEYIVSDELIFSETITVRDLNNIVVVSEDLILDEDDDMMSVLGCIDLVKELNELNYIALYYYCSTPDNYAVLKNLSKMISVTLLMKHAIGSYPDNICLEIIGKSCRTQKRLVKIL